MCVHEREERTGEEGRGGEGRGGEGRGGEEGRKERREEKRRGEERKGEEKKRREEKRKRRELQLGMQYEVCMCMLVFWEHKETSIFYMWGKPYTKSLSCGSICTFKIRESFCVAVVQGNGG